MSETRTSEYLQKLENKVRELEAENDIWKKEAMKLKAMAEIDKGIIRIAEKNAEKAWQDGFEAECKQANKSEIELQDKIGELEASSLTKDEARGIIEELADLEHTQWAHWTSYMLENLTKANIAKWKRQIKEPYFFLTEQAKESDRVWARKVIALFAKKGVDVKGKEGK